MCRIVWQWYNLEKSAPEDVWIPVHLPCCISFQSCGWKKLCFSFMGLSKTGKFVIKDFGVFNIHGVASLERAMLMTLEVSSICLRKAGLSLTRSAACLVVAHRFFCWASECAEAPSW
jgi:hypothetical protein